MFGSQERLHKRLLAEGLRAPAVVVQSEPTTWTMGYGGMATDRKWKVTVRVTPEGDEPFEVNLAPYFPAGKAPNEGSTMTVLYDPADHSKAMIDMDTLVSAAPPAGSVDTASVAETMSELSQMNINNPPTPWKVWKMRDQLKELNLAQARRAQSPTFATQIIIGPGGIQPQAQGAQPALGAQPAQGAQPALGAQPAQSAQPAQPAPDTIDQIAKLAALHESGSLTDEEFEQAKQRLLSE